MSVTGVIIAAAVVAGVGILIGFLLGAADLAFKVEVNEIELKVREALPGNNCGGCGYPGCDGLAAAIANGEAPAGACPVGGSVTAQIIAEITGQTADMVKNVAFVKCHGSNSVSSLKYEYHGNMNCKEAALVSGGGPKGCSFGCMGYGSCVSACEFDAIHVQDGLALVDREKCVACGKCIAECPKNLIEMVPYQAEHLVRCNSTSKGKDVKAVCSVGCIACKMCEKACAFDAVKVVNNLAHIDYDKCTNCGACAQKCPTKIIVIKK
ncbi:RnfABCDGE type electron transport complex subunit B [Parasporobacterium paucivorans]|uniref:Ion-translocating oxidoreductase complex subunit B n=1 Tax=Parasporobacterium paucivorans DSM 15970 TaxID=1122934 RepID=A0A1M6AD13_9FIRM|nr:RnfABCDGE type electron transport complex subunit B [Parasporobacterium paucivorans]SHI34228.1 electron transport complex, RnfABCDGE type, B subunit [Parasporobacterium paucivorans DSM 15970]